MRPVFNKNGWEIRTEKGIYKVSWDYEPNNDGGFFSRNRSLESAYVQITFSKE